MVNPAQVYHFRPDYPLRTKTDKVDAQTMARHRPPVWTPPVPQIRTLQALVRLLDCLPEMQTTEKNRQRQDPPVAKCVSTS